MTERPPAGGKPPDGRGPTKGRGKPRKGNDSRPSKGSRPAKGGGAGRGRRPARGQGGARPHGAPLARDPRPARPRGPRPLVAVFAKAPVPGHVKTRLVPALRPEEASDLYRALLVDTIDVVEAADARVTVAFTPATGRRLLERLLGAGRQLVLQPPGDLGTRLERVLGMLQESGGKRVLVVGSDCPGLTSERIREAYRALENAPVVLGPALDGGFYLLGTSRPATGLLRDIPWSTERVLEAMRTRLLERGLAIRELPEERDLDTPRDLFEWYASARETGLETIYPRTWKMLHSLMTPRRFADLESRLAESP